MKKIIYLFTCLFMLFNFSQCKNDKQQESGSNDSATNESSSSGSNQNPLIVELPKVYYHPDGLHPLTLVEMRDFGTNHPDSLRSLPLKNKHGEPITYSVLEDPEKPVFMQMYANEQGQVMEAVVYELNDTIRNLMMKVRNPSK